MKRNTIKWRIFKYNIIVIIMLITLTTIIFNIAVRVYIEKEIFKQLSKISTTTEDAALQHGPDFFKGPKNSMPPPLGEIKSNDIYGYYFMLDRTLKETLTVLNADFILLDKNKNRIVPSQGPLPKNSNDISEQVEKEIIKTKQFNNEAYIKFEISGNEYVAIIKPVSDKNTFGLGWVLIYSSIEEVNRIQLGVNIIFFAILVFSSLIIIGFSSILSKKISAPFSSLNEHISSIAQRNFKSKINMDVDDELKDLVDNINSMSEKLEKYDKSQKIFLQNVSHEFRTPLMSIQSYAEGILYKIVEGDAAANIIICESKRLTQLVENLLYLSRLDSLEEIYNYNNLNVHDLIHICVGRIRGIAIKNNIKILTKSIVAKATIYADEEKICRAITNIISNSMRYARSTITIFTKINEDKKIAIVIIDDGPGLDEEELPYIFDRFYKGTKGKFGLGLSISKTVVEKQNGTIVAENMKIGAKFTIELPVIL